MLWGKKFRAPSKYHTHKFAQHRKPKLGIPFVFLCNIAFLAQNCFSLETPLISNLEGNAQPCFLFATITLFVGGAFIVATPVHDIRMVFRCNFWMFHFDAKTPKRTSLWSSSASIGLFWTSKLKKVKYERAKKERGAAQPRPCRSYRDAEGRVRYHGTSELKQTEFRVWNMQEYFPFLPVAFGATYLFHAFSICSLSWF